MTYWRNCTCLATKTLFACTVKHIPLYSCSSILALIPWKLDSKSKVSDYSLKCCWLRFHRTLCDIKRIERHATMYAYRISRPLKCNLTSIKYFNEPRRGTKTSYTSLAVRQLKIILLGMRYRNDMQKIRFCTYLDKY
jgi:hypothetical protein